MDVFSHGLWAFAIFSKTRWKWWALLFGMLPDIIGFGPNLLMRIITRTPLGPPDLASIPSYTWTMYGISHSLIPVTAVLLLVFAITKKWFVPLFAYMISILVDIPTHTADFLPTPYLWPLQTPYVDGISWGTATFMFINLLALISVYLFYVFRVQDKVKWNMNGSKPKKKKKSSSRSKVRR